MAYTAYGLMFEVMQRFFQIQMKEEYGRKWKKEAAEKIVAKFDNNVCKLYT